MVTRGLVLFLLAAGAAAQGVVPGVADRCFAPVQTGPCRAYVPSYHFDPLRGSCDCFVYGGCGGNDNRFATLEECMSACSVRPELQTATEKCVRIFDNRVLVQPGQSTVNAAGQRLQTTTTTRAPTPPPTQAPTPAPTRAPTPAPTRAPTPAPEKEGEEESSGGRHSVQSIVIGPSGLGSGTLFVGQPVRIPGLNAKE